MPTTYLGWTVVTHPDLHTEAGTPVVPASIEAVSNSTVAAVTSEFTKQQQIHDFGGNFLELSVSYGTMSTANGQLFGAFLRSCNGMACVFTFPASLCALFPVELTTDGTTARYFRLKGNEAHWVIKAGKVYGFTFEVREAK